MQSNLQIEKLDIRTIVLVGRQDFGRCPLAAHLPMALWPIAGRPAVERLLDHLAEEGIRRVVVCSENDISEYIEPVRQRRRLEITTLNEDLSGGTAGCLRDAVGSDAGDLIMVFSGSMASPPPLRDLIESHHLHGADVTMVFNPGPSDGGAPGAPAEIYLCKPDVLRLIPAGGYSDIKEGLIPSILRAGGVVRPFVLTEEVGSFHDRSGYLHAVSMHLTGCSGPDVVETPSGRFQIAPQASIHRSARIWGPVAVGEQAHILEDTVVVGPAVIGPRAVIGCNSVVVRSVLWSDASVGNRCEVFESVLGSGAALSDRTVVAERTVVAGRATRATEVSATSARASRRHSSARVADRVEGLMEKLPVWARRSPSRAGYLVGGAVILMAFLWSYWATFADLYEVWRRNDEYSAGLLVPFLAAYALWVRRRDFVEVPVRPAVCTGILLFVVAQIIRGLGLYLMFGSAERLSMLMSVVAVALLLLGWSFLRKLAPALLFLCLMLPWPNRVQAALAVPLQGWATTSAVFCLELAGYEVAREGNIITIGDTRVAVAEACNGLRMITAFVVISGLVVLLTRRTWWEKMLILISSLPIALLCNTLRLTVTAVAFTVLTGENVEKLFHDFGGYAMMPLALALVVGELWFLARLTTPPADRSSTVITRRQPRQIPDS